MRFKMRLAVPWRSISSFLIAAGLFSTQAFAAAGTDAALAQERAAALFSRRTLPEPLVPTTYAVSGADCDKLTAALDAFERRLESDDFSALEKFVIDNPKSPWRFAIQTNLGLLYYHAGYFSKCIPAYLEAWKAGKDATDLKAKALADRAAGEYTKILARLGRYKELKAFLKEVKGRTFVGQATELMMAGTEGSTVMEQRPEIAFRCGPLALSRILASQNSPLWAAQEIMDAKSTMKGMSLAEVAELSKKLGMNYQPAIRTRGASLVMPSVIHWKVGHYAALIKKEGDLYLTQDPTFENETWHTLKAIEAEASGYFLVPPGPLSTGWAAVSQVDAKAVLGKGNTQDPNPDGPGPRDPGPGGGPNPPPPPNPTPPPPRPSPSPNPTPPPSPTPQCGMATYFFHALLASLHIEDNPVGYEPPYGGAIRFTATYTQRQANQPSNFTYSNLGQKWNFNWLDYISDDPANPAVASRGIPEGGTDRFSGYNSTTQQFAVQFDSNTVLTRTSSSPVSYTLTNPDGSARVFSKPSGTVAPRKVFLTQIIDPSGNVTTLNYDAQFRISTISDPIGQQTTFAYELPADPFKITKVTDPFGRSAVFSYDTSGRLIKIGDVIGIESIFAYEGTGNFIKSLTTPYGTTTFTSTDNGAVRRLSATDPAGDTEVLETNYGSTATIAASEASMPQNMALANNYLNFRNSFFWDKKQWKEAPGDYNSAHIYHWLHDQNLSQASRYLESEKMPLVARTWYNYAGQSNPIVVGTGATPIATGRAIEGSTQLTKQTLNALSRPTSQTDPLGRTTNFQYAANNIDLLSTTQTIQGTPPSSVTLGSYAWNTQHLPLTYTDAAGQPTTYTWNVNGQMTSVTNAKNETITYTYYAADAASKQRKGRLYQIDGALPGNSDVTTFDYDARGRVASVTGPDGYFLTYTYDDLDRPIKVIYPDTTYTETIYQALDPLTTRDRLGRLTSYVYNSIRQLVSVTDPANRKIQYRWCKCGALSQLIDAMGRVTTWKRDIAGRPSFKQYADGSKILYAYEPLSGRLKSITDEKGQAKTQSYNVDDTLAATAYTNTLVATPNVSFLYDPNFLRMTSMTDGTGTTGYTYNPIASGTLGAGQLASETGPLANSTITYTYDPLTRRTAYAVNGAGESRSFDQAGRVTSVINPLGTFAYTYVGATNRLNTITVPSNPNGPSFSYDYQSLTKDFRLKDIVNTLAPNNALLSQHSYDYDTVGNITQWTQTTSGNAINRTWICGYDDADQLTSVASKDPVTLVNQATGQYAYTYDLSGNRLTQTLDGSTTTGSYDMLNRLGTLTNSGTSILPLRTYEWDAENRLTAINDIGANRRSEFSYDGLGRRTRIVEKSDGSVQSDSRYLWDGAKICEIRDAAGSTILRRLFEDGETLVNGTTSTNYFYTADHLGSVCEIVDANGQLVTRYNYDPFGHKSAIQETLQPTFGFTHDFLHHKSGLYFTWFRVLDSDSGRWLSRDPLAESAGTNLYAYVKNNPISYVDPLGLIECPPCFEKKRWDKNTETCVPIEGCVPPKPPPLYCSFWPNGPGCPCKK